MPTNTPKPIILIVDSNILFTKKDVALINKGFLDKLEQCRAFAPIQLCIPRVCLGEIIFRKSTFAGTQLAQAEKALRIIDRLTDRNSPSVGTGKNLSRALARKALKWCKENGVLVARVPIHAIRWKRLIEAAVWRIPPFSPPSDEHEKDKEKGFKDSLVLETVLDVWTTNEHTGVIFVTNDNLLRETAKARLPKINTFAVYESMDEWLSHLKLAHDEKNKAFADVLLKNALTEFFQPDNPECVYIRCRVKEKILEVGAWNLSDASAIHLMNTVLPPSVLFQLRSDTVTTSRALSDNKIRIQPPAYLSSDAAGFYNFRSDIVFAKLYEPEPLQVGGAILPQSTQYIRLASFSAFWKSKVSAKAELSNSELERVTVGQLEAKIATDALRKHYGFPSELELLLQRIVVSAPSATIASTSQPEPSE